jgi:hypothetical protein
MSQIAKMLSKMGNLLANLNIQIVEGNDEEESSEDEDEEDEELLSITKMTKYSNETMLDMLSTISNGHLVQSFRCIPNNGLLNNPKNYFCPLFTKLNILHLDVSEWFGRNILAIFRKRS